MADAVRDNLERLAPWMPWATRDAATARAQAERLAAQPGFDIDGHVDYGIFTRDDEDTLVGCSGFHRRGGDDVLEIGYWITASGEGRGLVTDAVKALTAAGLSVDGVERIEIRCDEANERSAAVPARAGYSFAETVDRPVEAPAESGREMRWVAVRGEWFAPT